MKVLLLVLGGLAVVVLGLFGLGALRWSADTRALRSRLDALRSAPAGVERGGPGTVDFRELEGLPPVVERYFRAVLRDGQPIVTAARLRHRGTFDMGEDEARWRRFTSDQLVVTRPPGFLWDGQIRVLPGVTARVHDAYVDGEGILRASALGLVSLVSLQDGGELARGELLRFLAEAVWYPTALLPSPGVEWSKEGPRSARATLVDGSLTAALTFDFDEEGLVETVRAEARGRMVEGEMVATPWRGRFWRYETRSGLRIPLEGEVAWSLESGEKAYWRGRIVEIRYELAT